MDKNAPIGIFDSGVGGLTVAREVMRQLPDERIVYFGDTARLPYGTKSQDTVIRFSEQIMRFLRSKGCLLYTSGRTAEDGADGG